MNSRFSRFDQIQTSRVPRHQSSHSSLAIRTRSPLVDGYQPWVLLRGPRNHPESRSMFRRVGLVGMILLEPDAYMNASAYPECRCM